MLSSQFLRSIIIAFLIVNLTTTNASAMYHEAHSEAGHGQSDFTIITAVAVTLFHVGWNTFSAVFHGNHDDSAADQRPTSSVQEQETVTNIQSRPARRISQAEPIIRLLQDLRTRINIHELDMPAQQSPDVSDSEESSADAYNFAISDVPTLRVRSFLSAVRQGGTLEDALNAFAVANNFSELTSNEYFLLFLELLRRCPTELIPTDLLLQWEILGSDVDINDLVVADNVVLSLLVDLFKDIAQTTKNRKHLADLLTKALMQKRGSIFHLRIKALSEQLLADPKSGQ